MNRKFVVLFDGVSVLALSQFLWAGSICQVVAGTKGGLCYNGVCCGSICDITYGPCQSAKGSKKDGMPACDTVRTSTRWQLSNLEDKIDFNNVKVKRAALNSTSPEGRPTHSFF